MYKKLQIIYNNNFYKVLVYIISMTEEYGSGHSIYDKVIDVVKEQLHPTKELGSGTSFREDLAADSLDSIELAMKFEEKFSLTISDEEVEKLKTIGDVVKYVEEHS